MEISKSTHWRVARALLAVFCACAIALAVTLAAQPAQQAYAANSQTMHRLYNPNSGEHFYTSSEVEKNDLVERGWQYENKGWTAPMQGEAVYRLYNPNAGEHHYTPDAGERDGLVAAGWNDEGIGWYSDPAINVPLWRLYNPNEYANNHHYTTSEVERDHLLSVGWQVDGQDGIGWYGVDEGDYFATIDIKDYGTIVVSLNKDAAPKTVANFVKLVNKGFYDGLTFHRIFKDFMMQGGDPLGTGAGGSGENVIGEFSENNFDNPMEHKPGAIAMARSKDPNSASSQFYIVNGKLSEGQYNALQGHYAVFGNVISGMEIVEKIAEEVNTQYKMKDGELVLDPYGNPIEELIPMDKRPIINSITIGTF